MKEAGTKKLDDILSNYPGEEILAVPGPITTGAENEIEAPLRGATKHCQGTSAVCG